MWNRLLESGEDPFANLDTGQRYHEHAPGQAQNLDTQRDGSEISTLRGKWVDACLRFDELAGEHVLSQAFAYHPAETVCIRILQRGMAEIGQQWHEGRATVQQEHFASALALRRLETMVAATPPPTASGRILIGCPPAEEHTFIPLMLALLLRRQGRDVIYLGANVPLDSLADTVRVTKPDLVLLTAQQLYTAASLLETAKLLRRLQVAFAYGGLIFTQLSNLTHVIPGHYLGGDVSMAVGNAEAILSAPRIRDAQRQVSPFYDLARETFMQQQAAIEVEVWQRMQEYQIGQQHLAAANTNIGRNIRAALTLGDMAFMGNDIQWVKDLLVNHYHMPSDLLDNYLTVYTSAALNNLGTNGRVITDWLSTICGDLPHPPRQTVELNQSVQS
jgi:methanogenic corrinoid protein MtbC1